MSTKDDIIRLGKKNNGSLTFQKVKREGMHGEYLRLMVKEGSLERTERGQYILSDNLPDEMETIQNRFKRGVFSHESALFLLGFSDRIPPETVMTFPRKYNITSAAESGIKTYRVDEKTFETGITTARTAFGHDVRVYSIERTLCDLLRPNSHTSIEMVTDAFKRYSRSKGKKLPLLLEFASLFHVEGKVRNYMEVLL